MALAVSVRAIALDGVQPRRKIAAAKHLAHHPGQTLAPLGLPFRAQDQILPNLDQRVREPPERAVLVERVAFELAAIGHVVAHGGARDRLQLA